MRAHTFEDLAARKLQMDVGDAGRCGKRIGLCAEADTHVDVADQHVREDKKAAAGEQTAKEMSKDEQVGFHKGSLTVLAKERQEMQRILGIVEQLMQMHLAELKRLGVDLSKEAAEASKTAATGQKEKKPPIDELL